MDEDAGLTSNCSPFSNRENSDKGDDISFLQSGTVERLSILKFLLFHTCLTRSVDPVSTTYGCQ